VREGLSRSVRLVLLSLAVAVVWGMLPSQGALAAGGAASPSATESPVSGRLQRVTLDQLVARRTANVRAAPGASADTFVCYRNLSIRSRANGLFVSAELGFGGDSYGRLRARAALVGSWELFQFCVDSPSGRWSIQSAANGRWVSTELGWGGAMYGELRARASAIGPWEQYNLPLHEIQSTANGLFVSTELGWGGADYTTLRARASAIGPWELYQIL
jgi:hypothetical protein